MAETQEGQIVEAQTRELAPTEQSMGSALSPQELKAAVDIELEKREILINFVKSQLVENTDFGKIHINKNCPNKYDPTNCKVRGHFSKDTLYKPGMEKILSLMNLQSKLERDEDTIEMLTSTGYKTPTVAYRCVLTRNSQFLAEGRGAAEVGGNGRDVNSTIKIAEKRARMDATLSLGFSEFFTQDLEDMDLDKVPANVDQETGEIKEAPATEKQRNFADKLLRERGAKTLGHVVSIMKLADIKPVKLDQIDKNAAKKLIDFLIANTPEQIQEKLDSDTVVTDIPDDPLAGLDEAVDKLEVADIHPSLQTEMRDKFQAKSITGQAAILFSQATIGKNNPTTNNDAMKLIEALDKLEG